MDIYGIMNHYLLKIVKGKALQISFVVNAKIGDLETIKIQLRAEGLETEWDELSPILADRTAYLEPFFRAIKKEQKPRYEEEYCVEKVVDELIDRGLIKEHGLPTEMRSVLVKWRIGTVNNPPSEVDSEDMFSRTPESIPLAQRKARRRTTTPTSTPVAALAYRGDIECLTEKLTSVANAVEKSWDNTETIIKGMRSLNLLEDRLNTGLGGLDKTWNNTESILTGIKCLELKVDAVQESQAKLEKSLRELVATSKGQEKRSMCSFCESDLHSFRQCTEKRPCVICGRNNHPVKRCSFDVELSCRVCHEVGHAALLHDAEDQDFRMEILTTYGRKNFSHFLAPGRSGDRSGVNGRREFSWEGKNDHHGPDRQSWRDSRRSSGPYNKKIRRST